MCSSDLEAPGVSAAELASLLDRAFVAAAACRLAIAPDARGGTRKLWLRELENTLVLIYRKAFGRSAATSNKGDYPACRWVRCLCRIAEQRAAGWCPGLIFREIAALTDQSLITYLHRAAIRQRSSARLAL